MTSPDRAARAAPAAPVEYAEVRRALRLGRSALCGALLGASLIWWANGVAGSAGKAVVTALLVVHALGDRARTPLPALTLASFALGATAGTPGQLEGPLAAMAGCALAASLVVLPARLAAVPALALGAGTALRLSSTAIHTAAGATATALGIFETVLYVAALAVGGLAASRAVREARLRQMTALEAEKGAAAVKNQFVSMVSHELRTPLTNISGFALTLRDGWRGFDAGEVDDYLGVICRESDHLRALVDDVLVVPRFEAGHLPIEPVDVPLGPAVTRIAALAFPPGGGKGVSISVPAGTVVRADPNRLEQVLSNLLTNAARYGGERVSVEAASRGEEVQVTVADDGPGVDRALHERVFAPFEQGAPGRALKKGLGLGLTVCRVLVDAMGGRIWYEPGAPTGARFCFTLPAARPGGGEAAAHPALASESAFRRPSVGTGVAGRGLE